ncbi:MFS transporter [Mesorhizobium sp. M00.F.Ca.ET.216.01.1.1]|uniref:MFS transporter n=1 Tax=Mesorhizobium sp. M00.F.Ca.ET.216.01.1.1 TaxID=2500528 RepID=UPI000FD8BF12|nr:MFS transporter [Mesorhizobium sp. M00.F.Ca.ET.216.01.1.1]TGQ28517.1 DHA2 family efflux MFS transporter permease subunit [Mesorhizobium sp. M00.F.Ca.ET.216.01.1.1]
MSKQSLGSTKVWVLALTSIGSLMVVLDAMVVATALSTMRIEFDASLETLQWTMNAYNLSFAVLLMTGAALGDRFGRRRTLIAGLALFVAASVACALAGNAGMLIAARAVQGAGAAMVMPLAMALLSVAFPPEERGRALGIFSSITGLALIIGPMAGGAISEGLSWHWIFWLNVPVGIVLIPLVLRRIPESNGPGTTIDVLGVVLVTGAAFGVVWALMRGNIAGWGSSEVLMASTAGLLLAIAFVLWQLRTREPMLPLRFFRARAFSSGVGANFLLCAAMYGVVFLLPQFLQFAQSRGPLGAGMGLLPWTATLFIVAPISGSLINRVGERWLVVVGLILQAVGMAWLGLIAAPDLPYIQLVAPLVIAGAGVSMALPAAQNAVLNAVARPEVGKAAGTFNTFRFLGGVSGIAIAGAVFAGTGSFASTDAFSDGFTSAIGASALLSLAGALVGMGLPERRAVTLANASKEA